MRGRREEGGGWGWWGRRKEGGVGGGGESEELFVVLRPQYVSWKKYHALFQQVTIVLILMVAHLKTSSWLFAILPLKQRALDLKWKRYVTRITFEDSTKTLFHAHRYISFMQSVTDDIEEISLIITITDVHRGEGRGFLVYCYLKRGVVGRGEASKEPLR